MHSFLYFVKATDGNDMEESAHADNYTLTTEKLLHTLSMMTRRTRRILKSRCPKNLGEKILKMTSSDNDVDGDPLDVLTPPYIPTMMEHCFIMYNHDVYLVLKLRGHLKWMCASMRHGGGALIHVLNLKKARVPMSYHIHTVNAP